MKVKKVDRSSYADDILSNILTGTDTCQTLGDEGLNNISSLPLENYNQLHCTKTKKLGAMEEIFNCSVLVMFGIKDLNSSNQMCNGSVTEKTMTYLSRATNISCPKACIEESIDTRHSFTILSDEVFEKAAKAWGLPIGLDKENTVWLDIYYATLQKEVSSVRQNLSSP